VIRPSLATFVAVVAGLGVIAAPGCSGDGGEEPAATVTTAAPTTEPPQLPPGAVAVGLDDLEVGQCFLLPIDDPPAEDRAVWLVACEESHTHEVVDVIGYEGPDDDGAYPGPDPIQDWAEQACYARFEPFVGVPWTRSGIDIEVWWPSEDSWERDDRSVVCAVFPADGRRVTGTLRGTAQ
jgi:hypothetical protein